MEVDRAVVWRDEQREHSGHLLRRERHLFAEERHHLMVESDALLRAPPFEVGAGWLGEKRDDCAQAQAGEEAQVYQ
eukprot:scaffold154519_cov36-Tisochrysis_lutea.AAC.2